MLVASSRGVKVAGRIKVANLLTLKWEIILEYPVGQKVIRVLKSRRGISSQNQRDGGVRTQPGIADTEDGRRRPQAKECGWILEAGKGRERDATVKSPDRNIALLTHPPIMDL